MNCLYLRLNSTNNFINYKRGKCKPKAMDILKVTFCKEQQKTFFFNAAETTY